MSRFRRFKVTVAAIGTGLLVSLGPQAAVATLPLLPALAVAAGSFLCGLVVLNKTLASERKPEAPATLNICGDTRDFQPGMLVRISSEAPADGK